MTRTFFSPLLVVLLGCGGGGGTNNPSDGGGIIADSAPLADGAPGADAREPTGNILDDLRAIPGMVVTERSGPSGYRFFTLAYEQPVDHHDPDGPKFTQRLSLLHKSYEAPVVLYTHGYDFVLTNSGRYEATTIVAGNQVAVEHRFFGGSRPSPLDWSKLDIWQAANDDHRIVQALKGIYRGKWLNTGASKDGMTSVYHRRFFPDDVDGTIAYVAPLSLAGPDPRYVDFVEQTGTGESCRQKLVAFQRTAFARRTAMETRMSASAPFDILGLDEAFEHVVLELPFGFWQYGTTSQCGTIPADTATDADVFSFLDSVGDVSMYNDAAIQRYAGYYYQAATQLGWPQINEAHVSDFVQHPGTDGAPAYSPQQAPYDPAVMADIDAWVRSQGRTLLFVYGGYDPWSAGAFTLGNAADSFKFVVPGGNHFSNIADLPEPDRTTARDAVRRWAGVTGLIGKPMPDEPVVDERTRRRPL